MQLIKILKNRQLLIFAIIFIATLTRGYGIVEQDVFYWDEARHLNEAEWWAGERDFHPEIYNPSETPHPNSLKTFFVWTVAISGIFTGLPLAGFIVSVLFGVLTVAATYFLGRDFANKEVGLIASFLVAVNPVHIFYSKTALSESMAVFFFVLFLYLLLKYWKKDKKTDLFLAGTMLGISIGAKELSLLGILLFLLLELPKLYRKEFKKIAVEVAFFAAALLLILTVVWGAHSINGINFEKQILGKVYVLNIGGLSRNIIDKSPLKELPKESFASSFDPSKEKGFIAHTASAFLYYGKAMYSFPAAFALTIMGLLSLSIKRNRFRLLVFLWFIVFFVFFLSYRVIEVRNAFYFVIPISLLGAFGADFILKESKRINKSLAVFFTALIFVLFLFSLPAITGHSTFNYPYHKIACDRLNQEPLLGTISSEPPITAFYTKKESAWLSSWHPMGLFYGCYTEEECIKRIDTKKFSHIMLYDRGYNDFMREAIEEKCTPFFVGNGNRKIKLYRIKKCIEELKKNN